MLPREPTRAEPAPGHRHSGVLAAGFATGRDPHATSPEKAAVARRAYLSKSPACPPPETITMAKDRTTTAVRDTDSPVRLDAREVVHAGVDVHKATYHVALYSTTRGVLTTWVQPASPQALVDRLAPIRKHVAAVVYEAGPTGFALARRLRRKLLAVPGNLSSA